MTQTQSSIRPAALAGRFYPADPGALSGVIEKCLDAAPAFHGAPKAILAPHAGLPFSGPIAGTAYKALAGRRHEIRRVVLLGPCHRVPVRGFAVPRFEAFETPLGRVPLDRGFIDEALRHPNVEQRDDTHLPEHCLEIQLPFLQSVLDDFSIVPVIVGGVAPEQADSLLKLLWGGPETLVVVSSDLSHFLAYDAAGERDRAACRTIECLAPDALAEDQACGRHALRGLLARARDLDLRATTLDLRNSGDTAGRERRESVVGYTAVAFEDAATAVHSEAQRKALLRAAVQAILHGLANDQPPRIAEEQMPWPLRAQRACFVTLKADGQLRGCVGSVHPQRSLIADVASNAFKAAYGDRRFEALSESELFGLQTGMDLSVSILSQPRPLHGGSEDQALAQIQPGTDGLILQEGDKGALLLPQVWDALPDPRAFLGTLKRKAGLAEDHWSNALRLFRFRTETFGTRMAVQSGDGN